MEIKNNCFNQEEISFLLEHVNTYINEKENTKEPVIISKKAYIVNYLFVLIVGILLFRGFNFTVLVITTAIYIIINFFLTVVKINVKRMMIIFPIILIICLRGLPLWYYLICIISAIGGIYSTKLLKRGVGKRVNKMYQGKTYEYKLCDEYIEINKKKKIYFKNIEKVIYKDENMIIIYLKVDECIFIKGNEEIPITDVVEYLKSKNVAFKEDIE